MSPSIPSMPLELFSHSWLAPPFRLGNHCKRVLQVLIARHWMREVSQCFQQFRRGRDKPGVCPHFLHVMDMRPAGILGLVLDLRKYLVTLPDVGVGKFPSLPIVTSDCHGWRVYISPMDAPRAACVCVFCCHVFVLLLV